MGKKGFDGELIPDEHVVYIGAADRKRIADAFSLVREPKEYTNVGTYEYAAVLRELLRESTPCFHSGEGSVEQQILQVVEGNSPYYLLRGMPAGGGGVFRGGNAKTIDEDHHKSVRLERATDLFCDDIQAYRKSGWRTDRIRQSILALSSICHFPIGSAMNPQTSDAFMTGYPAIDPSGYANEDSLHDDGPTVLTTVLAGKQADNTFLRIYGDHGTNENSEIARIRIGRGDILFIGPQQKHSRDGFQMKNIPEDPEQAHSDIGRIIFRLFVTDKAQSYPNLNWASDRDALIAKYAAPERGAVR